MTGSSSRGRKRLGLLCPRSPFSIVGCADCRHQMSNADDSTGGRITRLDQSFRRHSGKSDFLFQRRPVRRTETRLFRHCRWVRTLDVFVCVLFLSKKHSYSSSYYWICVDAYNVKNRSSFPKYVAASGFEWTSRRRP